MAVQKELDFEIDYGDPEASDGLSVFSPEFDEAFAYDGNDLGAAYNKERTEFRLWAPTAWDACVVLYRAWDGQPEETVRMKRGERGVWSLTVVSDLAGLFYTFKVRIGSQWNEAVDPYAKAVSVNGDKGAIIDLGLTVPEGWSADKRPPFDGSPVDAVIYELSVRDMSVHPESGIAHKGKFLGLSESGTRGPGGIATGLDHIAGLGVTHVQLLPVFDFSTESVDETRVDDPAYTQYNWGYDPKNYNVPEGSYSTDPYDPPARIRELKTMIHALHSRGLRVIMDVVYNHMYDGYRAGLARLVPGYYFRHKPDRTLSNGSWCGNDFASERPMARKFIVDSILYWAKDYGMDGFRFDLMGLLDVGTMMEIRRRLDEIDPTLLTIGEGWVMETELPVHERANQHQAQRMPGIGHFNNFLRDALKGDALNREAWGFINGLDWTEHEIRKGMAGGIAYAENLSLFAQEPSQTVNFAECHDNHTLWDKIEITAGHLPAEIRQSMHRLATAVILTSQGIPFLHAGQEFMRTKMGAENSYNLPDEINRMDWVRCAEHETNIHFVRKLIALRKVHPAFRLKTAEEIRRHLIFEDTPSTSVACTLRDHAGGDPAKHLYVLHNANPDGITVELPELGEWQTLFRHEAALRLEGRQLTVERIGTVVLAVWE